MEKIKIISKFTVVFSALIMVISFGIVVFNADYGIPLIIGEIGGIIFTPLYNFLKEMPHETL